MGGDKVTKFKIAFFAFVGILALIILLGGLILLQSSKDAQTACETVQDNNQIFRDYLIESRDRTVKRIEEEEVEGLTINEINESYQPLIHALKRKPC